MPGKYIKMASINLKVYDPIFCFKNRHEIARFI